MYIHIYTIQSLENLARPPTERASPQASSSPRKINYWKQALALAPRYMHPTSANTAVQVAATRKDNDRGWAQSATTSRRESVISSPRLILPSAQITILPALFLSHFAFGRRWWLILHMWLATVASLFLSARARRAPAMKIAPRDISRVANTPCALALLVRIS